MSVQDRFKNSLLCAAIGDALGGPVEGLDYSTIAPTYGSVNRYLSAPKGHPLHHLKPGQYTDDFQQVKIVAETIIEKGEFDIDTFVSKFVKWGELNIAEENNPKYWWRYPGSTSIKATKKLASGIPWRESGSDNPTCGSAMRVAPIGLKYHNDNVKLAEYAARSSMPSHVHPQSVGASVMVARAVAGAVNDNFSLDDMVCVASWHDKEMTEKMRIARDGLKKYHSMILSQIGNSWLAKETVPTALYCAALNIDSPKEAIIMAVNNGGDADSIACITGAIVGAANDKLNVPEEWLTQLEDREKIEKMALDLYEVQTVNI